MVRGLSVLLLLYLAIVYLFPKPAAVAPEGWRLFGLFTATVAGLILQPVPGGALVLTAVTLCPLLAGMKIEKALSGYAEPNVWLVLAAFFISRSLLNTGLARRIALFFVHRFGGTSLGICYSLAFSDMVLATIIPSNGARSGGVMLPIVRSIAELYGSKPGATAGRLGSFLMTAVYQSVCVSSAMFFTGQSSNPIAAQMAGNAGYPITWSSWFLAGIVPGFCSILAVPWIILQMDPPEIRKTPEAAAFAGRELSVMGKMNSKEWILTAVFIIVCGFWITSGWHKVDITITALIGCMALLFTGVLTWEDVKSEKAAWDLFLWYGGLVMMGKALNDAKVTTVFANYVASSFESTGWVTLFVAALLIYFYAHYAFASITAHLLAMFPPFLAVLLAKGAPIGLTIFAFVTFVNFSAGLTNYGTTPAPMFFAQDYVSLQRWWKVGLVASLANIAIWGTIGFAWWKLIGIW